MKNLERALRRCLSVLLLASASGLAPFSAVAQIRVLGPAPVAGPALVPGSLQNNLGAAPSAAVPSLDAAPGSLSGSDLQPLEALPEAQAGAMPSAPAADPRKAAPQAQAPLLAGQEGGSAEQLRSPSASDAGPASKVAGKRILISGSLSSRPWIFTDVKRFAEENGMKLAVLDHPQRRELSKHIVADEDFIAADIDDHSAENEKAVVEKVAQWAKDKPIHLSLSYLNPYAQLAGRIADRLGAKGDPGEAVAGAHEKARAREAMNKVPELATPSRIVASAEEAAKAFFDIGGGGKVVLKPIKGGGSQGVLVDIDSPEKAAEAWTKIDGFLKEFMKRPDAGFDNLDQYPGILMERQLEGPEIDLELVVRKPGLGRRIWAKLTGRPALPVADFWQVSDNPPMDKPYAVEKGVTFPSQLSPEVQAGIRDAGLKALSALGFSEGNAHIEMIVTPDGPKLLEVNKRMGGLFVKPLVEAVTGFNLVEGALRAYLGLPAKKAKAPEVTMEARMMIARKGGTIEAIDGIEAARAMPGVERIVMFKKVGDRVLSPDQDMFDYPFYLSATGKNYDEAFARMQAAMSSIRLSIRQADGTLYLQSADLGHVKDDPMGLLKKVTEEQVRRRQAAKVQES